MKIGYIGVGEEPRRIDIHPDQNGSYLKEMQKLVGGLIEYFEPLYGTRPSLVVNENGIAECAPNRAIFATKEMEEKGFQFSSSLCSKRIEPSSTCIHL